MCLSVWPLLTTGLNGGRGSVVVNGTENRNLICASSPSSFQYYREGLLRSFATARLWPPVSTEVMIQSFSVRFVMGMSCVICCRAGHAKSSSAFIPGDRARPSTSTTRTSNEEERMILAGYVPGGVEKVVVQTENVDKLHRLLPCGVVCVWRTSTIPTHFVPHCGQVRHEAGPLFLVLCWTERG